MLFRSGEYITSMPLLSWQGQHEDPFTNPENIVKTPLASSPRRMSTPYMDLFDLDMYLEASLAINTINLGVCSLEEESENPFEDTFAMLEPESEPEPVVTISPESSAVAVPMNHFVKDRDVYRPSG